jgi:hypothetical protein
MLSQIGVGQDLGLRLEMPQVWHNNNLMEGWDDPEQEGSIELDKRTSFRRVVTLVLGAGSGCARKDFRGFTTVLKEGPGMSILLKTVAAMQPQAEEALSVG